MVAVKAAKAALGRRRLFVASGARARLVVGGDMVAEEVEIKASVKLFRNYDLMALNELSVWAQKK